MTRTRLFLAALIAGSVAFYSGNALALLLDPNVIAGMQAQGTVFGATPQRITDEEVRTPTTPPPATFARSIVSVANSGTIPDPFQYAASADIGNLELKVFGIYTNSSGSPGNIETAFMSVHSHVRDVITLKSMLPDPYEVTLELDVNGSIFTSGGSAIARANSFLQLGASVNSARYDIGVIDDEPLSVIQTDLSGPSVDLEVEAFLTFNVFQVDAGATVTGDLGNTAFLRLVLPPGVTVAGSASGTFGVPIPIPEPHTYALMLAGLMFVGTAARRRLHR